MADRFHHRRAWVGRLRATCQGVFLVLFVYLALAVTAGWLSPSAGGHFLRIDPLVWLAGSLSARGLAPHLIAALALLLVTMCLGRVFCGWVCPLGTLIDAGRSLARNKRSRSAAPGWRSLRFWILAALLGMALIGVNLAGWFDPLVIGSRAIHAAARIDVFGASVWIAWGFVVLAILLTLLATRFWCRSLCPLGALLSLVSRPARTGRRILPTCTQCGACAAVCPMENAPDDPAGGECIACRRCEAVCPRESIRFAMPFARSVPLPDTPPESKVREMPADSRRRRILAGMLTGVGGVSLGMALGSGLRLRRNAVPLRPPGGQVEAEFAARCIGCGACIAVCPTGGLRPLISLDRLDALFSPQLVPRAGPCLPECSSCGDACPTGAIPGFAAAEKPALRIGTAEIDRGLCLPWATGERCVVCVDACPSEFAAVTLRAVRPRVFRPFVDPALCTGCGICEHRCPLEGLAAIRVGRG